MRIFESERFKQLKRQKAEFTEKHNAMQDEVKTLQRETALVKNKLDMIESELKAFNNKEIGITDHAIVRFFERAMGFDISQVKEKILDSRTLNAINTLGNGKYPIVEDCKAVVKNRTVITITKKS